MNVYWLEQTEADVPLDDDWLSVAELDRVNAMRFAKRRSDLRLGRWTAKQAVANYLHLANAPRALAEIELRPASDGAPEAFVANERAALALSLSHRAGRALCAVAAAGVALGCDLEVIEPRSVAFVADYFTREEQALIEAAPATERHREIALLWSAKESALKALRTGLRLDTRSVIVSRGANLAPPAGALWQPLLVRFFDFRVFHGWWQSESDLLRTLISDPPGSPSSPD